MLASFKHLIFSLFVELSFFTVFRWGFDKALRIQLVMPIFLMALSDFLQLTIFLSYFRRL
jgi:hypothetical protein